MLPEMIADYENVWKINDEMITLQGWDFRSGDFTSLGYRSVLSCSCEMCNTLFRNIYITYVFKIWVFELSGSYLELSLLHSYFQWSDRKISKYIIFSVFQSAI